MFVTPKALFALVVDAVDAVVFVAARVVLEKLATRP